MGHSTIILCPLHHESRAALRAAGSFARVIVCGPGGDRAREGVERCASRGASRIILFGTCGGLCETDPAPTIGTIIDGSGGRWTTGTKGVTMLCVPTPLWSIDEKRSARERTGADIVDCESAPFAEACEHAGIQWSVIRGISDSWDEALPLQAAQWVAPDGSTRLARVVLECVRSPTLIGAVRRLSRRSDEALRAAAERLSATLRGATP